MKKGIELFLWICVFLTIIATSIGVFWLLFKLGKICLERWLGVKIPYP